MMQVVNPQQLSSKWPIIKHHIEDILDELNKDCLQELWIVEDVYHSIKIGESHLLVCDEGFVIVQVTQDKYTGEKKLLIWLAHSYDPAVNVVEVVNQYLVDLAKTQECSMLGFRSTRRGWLKKATAMGYFVGPTEYVMRI